MIFLKKALLRILTRLYDLLAVFGYIHKNAVEFDENNEVVLGCGNCDLLDKN